MYINGFIIQEYKEGIYKGTLDDSAAYEKWLENQNGYFGGEENEI